jgi:MoxR-like ATPase
VNTGAAQRDILQAEVEKASAFIASLITEMEKVLVGQRYMVEGLLIGLLADGHVLLEGVPGLAKTTAVRALAGAMDIDFKRIQFSPDLLPSDLVGTMIWNQAQGRFETQRGPVFANLVLADEINRAPAKVQSALLESMQERQVTLGGTTHSLPDPFLVLATQNPLEQEGTYPLPEAQIDRFLLKLRVGYPNRAEEAIVVDRALSDERPEVTPVANAANILASRKLVRQVYMDEGIKAYILDLVHATRDPRAAGIQDLDGLISYGASPRASIALALTAKAHAFLRRRAFVLPDDVKRMGMDVLRHRILLSYEAEAEEISQEDVIQKIFDRIEVP